VSTGSARRRASAVRSVTFAGHRRQRVGPPWHSACDQIEDFSYATNIRKSADLMSRPLKPVR
jgi:hypothetical protein